MMNPEHPVFNDKYEILSNLGEGKTAKVYLARSIEDKEKLVAIKVIDEELLKFDKS
jgi:serine/threonine protein kinase